MMYLPTDRYSMQLAIVCTAADNAMATDPKTNAVEVACARHGAVVALNALRDAGLLDAGLLA